MKERKLGTYQAIAIIVTVMIGNIILDVPSHLVSETGPATVLNLIYIFTIMMIIFLITVKLFRVFPNHDIFDVCEYAAGTKIKNVFCTIICAYFLVISAYVIRTFSENLILIYFPNIDIEVVMLIFIVIAAIMNIFGFKSIARTAVIILPTILVTMIVIFFSSVSEFTIQRALPVLGYGASTTFLKGLRKYLCF